MGLLKGNNAPYDTFLFRSAARPINRMIPRSWMTSLPDGQTIAYEASIPVGGIAMGGDCGVAKVDVSSDGGRTSWPS